MQSNKQIDVLILRNLLGDLSTQEQAELDAWLDASPENMARKEAIQKSWKGGNLSKDWANIHLGENWQDILCKAGLAGAEQKRANLQAVWKYAAAAVVIMVSGIWAFYHSSETSINNSGSLPLAYELPDGSDIWLKQGASVSFNERSFMEDRSISMQGEVFYEVTKGLVPFIVTAGAGRVEVLGTSFNVKTDDQETGVVLLEGSVRFTAEKHKETLVPGETAVWDGANIAKRQRIDVNAVGWKTGVFDFSNQSLDQVVAYLRPYYGVTFSVSKDKKDLTLTTTFDRLSLDELIAELTFILDVEVVKTDQKILIR